MSDFMHIAEKAAALGTCSRLQVGAVLVNAGGYPVSAGWNGVPLHMSKCEHTRSSLPCALATHAEVRTIGSAAFRGKSTRDATLYVTHSPCLSCAQLIIAAGLAAVVYRHDYRRLDGLETLRGAGLRISRV